MEYTRTVGWGRFAGFLHGPGTAQGIVVCTSPVVWQEHWAWGRPLRHKPFLCPSCFERAAIRTRCALAFRRRGELGWRIVEGGTRFADRLQAAIGSDPWYGAIVRLSRDGLAPNASLLVEVVGRASWRNPNRPPVAFQVIAALVFPQ